MTELPEKYQSVATEIAGNPQVFNPKGGITNVLAQANALFKDIFNQTEVLIGLLRQESGRETHIQTASGLRTRIAVAINPDFASVNTLNEYHIKKAWEKLSSRVGKISQ